MNSTIIGLLAVIVVMASVLIYLFDKFYKQTTYYQVTKKPYLRMKNDIGSYGEYLTYKQLHRFERKGGRLLFNCYLNKDNGETTEIDVLLISHSGIFVFESKNYSGWIFGDEKSKTWTQTLPAGQGKKAIKQHFLNPIMQNALHIKTLQKMFDDMSVPVYSVIVFSERCELKKINIQSTDIHVIHRNEAPELVQSISSNNPDKLTDEQINNIYDKLYPGTQVDEKTRQKHIDDIKASHEHE